MTLITFVLTEHYVVLASDRRITRFRSNGSIYSQEDEAMKTFVINGQLLLGYTGVAEFDGVPMDRWLSETLSGVHPNDIPRVLASTMESFYGSHPPLAGIPHHFRAAGFAVDNTTGVATVPSGFEIGNADWREKNGKVRAENIGSFGSRVNFFGNRRQAVGAVGYPYSLQSLQALEGKVRFAIRANPLDPSLVFEHLVRFTRQVARNSGGMVGETVIITALPRVAVPMKGISVSVPLVQEGVKPATVSELSSLTFPDGAGDPTAFLPGFIYPNFQAVDFKIEVAPPDQPLTDG